MKQRYVLPVLLILFLLLAACNQDTPTATDASGAAVVTAATSGDDTVPEPAASAPGYPAPDADAPADTAAAAVDSSDAEPLVVANAIPTDELTLDVGDIPYTPTVLAVDGVPYRVDDTMGPTGLPAHWRVDFEPQSTNDHAGARPAMYIIPVEAYRALWAESGDIGVDGTLTALIMTIEEGVQPFQDAGVPGLPVEYVGTAFNDLAAQGEYLALENVTGLRFVGRFAEEPSAVTNEGLTYVFLGFTNDGQYLVSYFHPIRSEALPNSAADVAAEATILLNAEPYIYLSEQAVLLNEQSDGGFMPSLADLDRVVASLQLVSEDAAVAAETEAGTETAALESATAVGDGLAGTEWQWTALVQSSSTTSVDDSSRYTVRFVDDGTIALDAGCHQGNGTYVMDESGALAITLTELLLKPSCPPTYLDAILVGGLGNTASFEIAEGQLTISLKYDNGILSFGPVTP